jgi:putative FmdB family regulatory protein
VIRSWTRNTIKRVRAEEVDLTRRKRPKIIATVSQRRCGVPIYEFVCRKCGREFEELVYGSDDGVECPECGASSVERKMSTFAFKSGGKMKTAGSAGCSSCHSSSCSSCKH